MIRPTPIRIAALAAVALLGLGACGSDDGDDAAATTEAPTDTTEAAPVGEPADCDAGPGETVTVEIPEFVFDPNPVEVSACDEVVWANTHNQAHTSTGDGGQAWNTQNIAPDSESDAILFDTPGSYTYKCALHPFMEGTVEVS